RFTEVRHLAVAGPVHTRSAVAVDGQADAVLAADGAEGLAAHGVLSEQLAATNEGGDEEVRGGFGLGVGGVLGVVVHALDDGAGVAGGPPDLPPRMTMS